MGNRPYLSLLACLWAGLVVVSAGWPVAPAASARGDTVRTTEGQTHEGAVRLEGGRVVVKPETGAEVKLDFAKVREILHRPDPPAPEAQVEEEDEDLAPDEDPDPKKRRGLRAEFYADRQMKQLKLVRIDRAPGGFSFSAVGTPHPLIGKTFTVRWTGSLELPEALKSELIVETNGALRIWIDEQPLVDLKDTDRMRKVIPIQLEGKRKYQFRCEFSYYTDKGGAMLKMALPGKQNKVMGLSNWFKPPEDSPAPVISIVSPRRGEILAPPEKVIFEAMPDGGERKIKLVRFYLDGRLFHTLDAAPWKVEWTHPIPGYRDFWVEAVDDRGMVSSAKASHFIRSGTGGGTLPEPWREMPIGVDAWIGSARWDQQKETVTLEATGGDLRERFDEFHFLFHPMTGDGSFVARMESVEPTMPSTTAGIVLRPDLSERCDTLVLVGKMADTMVSLRREKGSGKRKPDILRITLPCWLKISRHGNMVKTYHSEDGTDWQLIAARPAIMPQTVFVGFTLLGSPERKSKAIFSNISITPGGPEMETAVAGVMLRDGTMIPGRVRWADGTSVRFMWRDKELSIPQQQIARLIFAPIPAEMVNVLRPGRTGALLKSGDFVDGAVSSVSPGSMLVESVLFGPRKLRSEIDALAAIIADVEVRKRKYEVHASDGALFHSDKVELVGDRLRVEAGHGLSFELRGGEVTELRMRQ